MISSHLFCSTLVHLGMRTDFSLEQGFAIRWFFQQGNDNRGKKTEKVRAKHWLPLSPESCGRSWNIWRKQLSSLKQLEQFAHEDWATMPFWKEQKSQLHISFDCSKYLVTGSNLLVQACLFLKKDSVEAQIQKQCLIVAVTYYHFCPSNFTIVHWF